MIFFIDAVAIVSESLKRRVHKVVFLSMDKSSSFNTLFLSASALFFAQLVSAWAILAAYNSVIARRFC